jgi:ATP-dependent helicase HepA
VSVSVGPSGTRRFHPGQFVVRKGTTRVEGCLRVEALDASQFTALTLDGERRQYVVADFEPVVLVPGMRCRLSHRGPDFFIEAVRNDATNSGLRYVRVSHEQQPPRDICETELSSISSPRDVVEYLTHFCHFDSARLLLRERLRDAQGNCRGMETILGARIQLFEHQIAVVQKVLSLAGPRALLGDEVGLGKTIECGLILSVLLKHKSDLRVLIVCPGTLTQQWLAELYSKFHSNVFYVPSMHERLASIPAHAPRIIVSTRDLADPKLRQQLEARRWDVLVVDEAHRIPSDTNLFSFLRALSGKVPGLLLLSATPVRSRAQDFVRLLALLNPNSFAPEDTARLEALRPLQAEIEELFAQTEGCTSFVMALRADAWRALLPEDKNIERWAHEMRRIEAPPKDRERARNQLLRYVADVYRLDDRIIRNRRDGVGQNLSLPKRVHESLVYTPSDGEEATSALLQPWSRLHTQTADSAETKWLISEAWQRSASSASALSHFVEARVRACAQPSRANDSTWAVEGLLARHESNAEMDQLCRMVPTVDGEMSVLSQLRCALKEWKQSEQRVEQITRWIAARLTDNAEDKVLVFTSFAETLEQVSQRLATALRPMRVNAQVFHVGLSPDQRERNALSFMTQSSCRVLVCDESGGEGRNFQAARWVVHVDLPWDLGAIEQRIGRIDRIGRSGTVLSVSIGSQDGIENFWSNIVWKYFEIGARTLSGLEFLAEEIGSEFKEHACRVNIDAIVDWSMSIPRRIADERQRIASDEERRLDAMRFDLDEVRELIDELKADAIAPKEPILRWARAMGIDIRSHGAAYFFDLASTDRKLPSHIRPRFDATFERWLALKDPSLQLLAWGHPFVEWLLSEAIADGSSRCATISKQGERSWRGCRTVVVCAPDPGRLAQVPAYIRGRVTFDARPEEHTLFVHADGSVEVDREFIKYLEQLVSASTSRIDPQRFTSDTDEHRSWVAEVERCVQVAWRHVSDQAIPTFQTYAEELEKRFGPEMSSAEAVRAWRGKASRVDDGDPYKDAVEAVRAPLVSIDSLVWIELQARPR